MEYEFKSISILELVNILDSKKIDLNPSYQRNFIWSTKDQSELVDTILQGYPLPNFFIYEKPDGSFEMVDGQQRTTTIYNFMKGRICSTKKSGKKYIQDTNFDFDNYCLPVVFLKNIKDPKVLNEFYVLINKKGKHLNIPEVNKSEYHDTTFLKLANELLNDQNFIELNLFTEAAGKRMNDRSFVEELLGLLQLGIREKKKSVKKLFEEDINQEEYENLKTTFLIIVNKINCLNQKIKPIKKTRYKQRNDFYTLFNFVFENDHLNEDILNYQFKILVFLDGKDKDGRQFIRPTNEECEPLRQYANNCVSQSNSKSAREQRLDFFEKILLNEDYEDNEDFKQVLIYFTEIYGTENIDVINKGKYQLLDLNKISNV